MVNAACAGYNSFNYYKGFKHWTPLLEPDLVLVGFVPAREQKCDPEDTRFVIRDGILLGRYRDGRRPTSERRVR